MAKAAAGPSARMLFRVGIAMALSLPAFAAPPGPAQIDTAWREQFVMGAYADVYRARREALGEARAALEAARARQDVRGELQAAVRLLAATPDRTPENCTTFTHYVSMARAGGAAYERELFDLAAATPWAWIVTPCPSRLSTDELRALAQRLGDPGRMFFVLEQELVDVAMADRQSEMVKIYARQIDYAIAGFQRATRYARLADIELVSDPKSTAARQWIDRARAEFDPAEFPFLAADVDANLAILEFRAGKPAAAMATVARLVPLFRRGVVPDDAAAMNLVSFANYLIKLSRGREALELLNESQRYPLDEPIAIVSRASILVSAYALVRSGESFAKGEREIQRIREVFNTAPASMPRRPLALRTIADFYESYGRLEQALAVRKELEEAMEDAQRRANDAARVQARERLDASLKEQENARLKAEAELQVERQRGWIAAFCAVALGGAAAGIALAVAVRRGRRLAKVSAELAYRNAELEQRSASRIRLLAAACHDLRQPAHALGMLAELGSDANAEPTRYTTWLQSVRRSTASLGDMLDELMDLGRLDGGHYTPHLSDVSLGELLQEVMLHFGPLAKRKGLTLEAPPVNFLVVSDRHLLRRMVFNLVSNAIKYTDAGSVSVGVELLGSELLLTVQDTGPGIPQDKLDDVFRDYVRLNPLKAAEGLGIGLSIVRRSAELLGHRLTLASPPGEGTTVSLTLPISTSEMVTEPGESLADAMAAADAVLVILEDDADVREAMAALLRRWHYTVFAAGEAEAALAQLAQAQARPALVITDLHLGGTDGLAEVARLRDALQAPHLPALLVTGDLDATVASQAAQAQVFVAHKPLAPRKLAELVAQLLGSATWSTAPGLTAASPSPSA